MGANRMLQLLVATACIVCCCHAPVAPPQAVTVASTTVGSSAPLVAGVPRRASVPPREWVLGNHSGHSAVELCALGSKGCMEGQPEEIDVAAENAGAIQRLQQLQLAGQQSLRIIIVPGDTPDLVCSSRHCTCSCHSNAAAIICVSCN